MKLYVVNYCANEFDDLGYDSPYPIYYSLNKDAVKNFYIKKFIEHQKDWVNFCINHPELKNNEDYYFKNSENSFEYSIDGKWFYEYTFNEVELEKDLRYESND